MSRSRCLNWTKVGLKDGTFTSSGARAAGLNWTKVGLKVERRPVAVHLDPV